MSAEVPIKEYQLYQLVHEGERSIGLALGDSRTGEDGLVEEDTLIFEIRSGATTGRVVTDVFQMSQQEGDRYYRTRVSEKTQPFVFPEGATIELIEPEGMGDRFEDPLSPVKSFVTNTGRVLNLNLNTPTQYPVLRVTLPQTQTTP
jgi:hypothetical protein